MRRLRDAWTALVRAARAHAADPAAPTSTPAPAGDLSMDPMKVPRHKFVASLNSVRLQQNKEVHEVNKSKAARAKSGGGVPPDAKNKAIGSVSDGPSPPEPNPLTGGTSAKNQTAESTSASAAPAPAPAGLPSKQFRVGVIVNSFIQEMKEVLWGSAQPQISTDKETYAADLTEAPAATAAVAAGAGGGAKKATPALKGTLAAGLPATNNVLEAVVIILDTMPSWQSKDSESLKMLVGSIRARWPSAGSGGGGGGGGGGWAKEADEEVLQGRRALGEALSNLLRRCLVPPQTSARAEADTLGDASATAQSGRGGGGGGGAAAVVGKATIEGAEEGFQIDAMLKDVTYVIGQLPDVFVFSHHTGTQRTLKGRNSDEWMVDSHVPRELVLAVLDALLSRGDGASALRVFKLFPNKVDMSIVTKMCATFLEDSSRESNGNFGNLISLLRDMPFGDPEQRFLLFVHVLDSLLGDASASRALGRCSDPSTCPRSPFDHFVVQHSTSSLQAAQRVVEIWPSKHPSLQVITGRVRSDLSFRVVWHKMEQQVRRGKWQIAAQLTKQREKPGGDAKSRRLYLNIFNLLKEMELYSEAAEAYGLFQLHNTRLWEAEAHLVVPVTPEQLHKQQADVSRHFLQSPLHPHQVEVVSTLSGLEAADRDILGMVRAGTQALQFVGVDSEWFAFSSQNGASILQIAITDKVYIFDLKGLGRSRDTAVAAESLLRGIFHDPRVIKVGFEFKQSDMHMLRLSARGAFSAVFDEKLVAGVFEVQPFLRGLETGLVPISEDDAEAEEEGGGDFKEGGDGSADGAEKDKDKEKEKDGRPPQKQAGNGTGANYLRSLSAICAYYLGKPLHKTMRLSDWNLRPMTPAQLTYASLDAHCILALVDISIRQYHDVRSIGEGVETPVPLPASLGILEFYEGRPSVMVGASAAPYVPGVVNVLNQHFGKIEKFLGRTASTPSVSERASVSAGASSSTSGARVAPDNVPAREPRGAGAARGAGGRQQWRVAAAATASTARGHQLQQQAAAAEAGAGAGAEAAAAASIGEASGRASWHSGRGRGRGRGRDRRRWREGAGGSGAGSAAAGTGNAGQGETSSGK